MVSLSGFEIVKTHKEFGYIYNKAKSYHTQSVVLFYIPQKGVRKVGFTATKKIGNAVKRNRAKRLMRALFIENAKNLKDGRYVFVAKADINTLPFKTLKHNFSKNLTRANAIKKKSD